MNLESFNLFKSKISYFSNSARIYFDSTSFTLINDLVLEATDSFYKAGGTRPLTGLYPGTSLASVTIEHCRKVLRNSLGIKDGELIFPLSRGIGSLQIIYSLFCKTSIEILSYSGLDHEIWLPIFEFACHESVRLVPLEVQNSLVELEQEIMNKHSNLKTTLTVIIIPFTSLGNGLSLNKEFLQRIKEKTNSFILLDMTYAIGVTNIIFSDLPIDAVVFDSNIGLGGPIGSGILYCKEDYLTDMKPYVFLGNGSISKVDAKSYSLETIPQRLESSVNPSLFAGLTKSIELLNQLSISDIHLWIEELKNYFFDLLSQCPEIQLMGSSQKQNYHNIIGLIIPDINMHELAMFLDEIHFIDIRSGSFCAHQLIDQLYNKLKLSNSNFGILQITFHFYNTKEEIERLFLGIKEFLAILK